MSVSIRKLKKRAKRWIQLRDIRELAALVRMRPHRLQLMALRPAYRHFSIPKPDGSLRYLEDPSPDLKTVQREINRHLQAVYYFQRSEAAYGFLICPKRDPEPRNILTNAYQHLAASHLCNIDMEDFFHSISLDRIFKLFTSSLFDYEDDFALLLARLCCYQERLPMGAPTSPILSNFVCLGLDAQLSSLCKEEGIVYTRFADDMSFSSQSPITEQWIKKVEDYIQAEGYRLNQEKYKRYGPEDTPIVTGLRLDEGQVKLPAGFLKEMEMHIVKLGHVLDVHQHQGGQSKWVREYQQKIEGMLSFASFILGDQHPAVARADQLMDQALEPADEAFGAMSWLEFGYMIHI